MESEPSTSLEVNNFETPISKRWTRDLNSLPEFTYELLTKHLQTEQSGGAQKHKKLGYQMFKDKRGESKCHQRLHVMFLD